MYFVYVLKSIKFAKTYTGITDDINRRLNGHNESHTGYTNKYKPWVILYTEKCRDRIEARGREKYLKSATGRKWIKEKFFEKS
jgi:putative endonuclease